MSQVADGGGVTGLQGDSYATGAQIRDNVIEDLVTPYNFGIDPDYDSAWVTIGGNVAIGVNTSAVVRVTPLMHRHFSTQLPRRGARGSGVHCEGGDIRR